MGKINNDNYVVIQGWMRNELNLKGNELMVYAIIYGFSQDGENDFTGSAAYMADWIGSTKQTVFNILKSLTDKGLIKKTDVYNNGVKFCHYSALPPVKNFDRGVVKKFDGGDQKILPNNIDINNINNIDNIYSPSQDTEGKTRLPYSEIVEYLNEVTGKHFTSRSKATQTLIKARINEGYTVEDFKRVIDIKASQWLNDPKFDEYLRPKTLFGTKFESYLNQKKVTRQENNNIEVNHDFREQMRRNQAEIDDLLGFNV